MNRVLTRAGGQGVLVGRDGALHRPRSAMADRKGALRRGAWWPWGGLGDFWLRGVRLAPDADVPAGRPYLAGGRPYLAEGRRCV